MQTIQQTFKKDCQLKKPYSLGPYNKVKGNKQAIRITEGCVWNCPNCHEPTELKIFGIPNIIKNDVLIFDMNPLCKPEFLGILKQLRDLRVNDKPVRYEFVCGVDYRFMTQEIADILFTINGYVGFDGVNHKKKQIRLAWDGSYSEQYKIVKAINKLIKAGFKRKEIMLFMQANHKRATFQECCLKLDLCKVWGVQVCDCYFDGQIGERIIPVFWSGQEIKIFRKKVRKHNQLVNFGIDPEVHELTDN
jgi:hypothetical protein